LEVEAIDFADFQVERLRRDDAEEESATIQPDSPEHRARRHVAQFVELREDEVAEGRVDLEMREWSAGLLGCLLLGGLDGLLRDLLHERPAATSRMNCTSPSK